MAGFSELGGSLERIAVDVGRGGDKIVRKAALAIDQVVVTETPVDTGRARSNWLAAVDDAPEETVEAHFPGKDGSTAGPNTQASIEAAAGVIAGYDGDANKEIHITNNLPYIQRLNDGWSSQAPANYVQAGVAAAVEAIQGARILGDDD